MDVKARRQVFGFFEFYASKTNQRLTEQVSSKTVFKVLFLHLG